MIETPDEVIGPINLGNPGEFTILELAEKVIELTGSKSPIVRKPLPADDPVRRRPDIALAKQHLDWEPKMPLEHGLKPTIHFFDNLLAERRVAARKVVELPGFKAPQFATG